MASQKNNQSLLEELDRAAQRTQQQANTTKVNMETLLEDMKRLNASIKSPDDIRKQAPDDIRKQAPDDIRKQAKNENIGIRGEIFVGSEKITYTTKSVLGTVGNCLKAKAVRFQAADHDLGGTLGLLAFTYKFFVNALEIDLEECGPPKEVIEAMINWKLPTGGSR